MDFIREKARRLTIALFKIDEIYFTNEQKISIKESELCLMYALDDGKSHSQRQVSEQWLIPKTTLNTIVKQWERKGLLTLSAIPGKRREMQISLTEAGKKYAEASLDFMYQAENQAVQKTLERYSDTFIEALEYFGGALNEAFEHSNIEKTAFIQQKEKL